MASFILRGVKYWKYVNADELSQEGQGRIRLPNNDLAVTPAVKPVMDAMAAHYAKHPNPVMRELHDMGPWQPSWEDKLNGFVIAYIATGHVSTTAASELFTQLGQEEGQAIRTMDHRLMAKQRVREAVLGFNLLATGSTWQPVVKMGFPYQSRNWVEWCNSAIETMQGAARDIYSIDVKAWEGYDEAVRNLLVIRDAFEAETFAPQPQPQPQKSGCYIATAVYGGYDVPEVRVLRRWRDDVLQASHIGRGMVRVYYFLSPKLVRTVGSRRWFKGNTRKLLDRFVARLTSRGFDHTPYVDVAFESRGALSSATKIERKKTQ